MLFERQLLANRENAQKSTGPRTPEGKAVCAKNAARFEGLADDVLTACEDRQVFIRYARRFHREFRPYGPVEKTLVNDMIAACWRRDRLGVLEARLLDHAWFCTPEPRLPAQQPAQQAAAGTNFSPAAFRQALAYRDLSSNSRTLAQLSRDAARHNRAFLTALATLERRRAARAKSPSAPPAPAPADRYPKGDYDRALVPPPADCPEDFADLFRPSSSTEPAAPVAPPAAPEDSQKMGLFGSVLAPETAVPEPAAAPCAPTESTTCPGVPAVRSVCGPRTRNAPCRPTRAARRYTARSGGFRPGSVPAIRTRESPQP